MLFGVLGKFWIDIGGNNKKLNKLKYSEWSMFINFSVIVLFQQNISIILLLFSIKCLTLNISFVCVCVDFFYNYFTNPRFPQESKSILRKPRDHFKNTNNADSICHHISPDFGAVLRGAPL